MQLRHTEGSQHELKVALFHKTDQKRQKNVIFWVFFKEISNRIGQLQNCRKADATSTRTANCSVKNRPKTNNNYDASS